MDIFKENLNKWYVETGSSTGSSIVKAREAGFPNIRGIELSFEYFEYCRKFFADNEKIKVYHGDSTEILWDVIKDIKGKITFFLDAHFSDGGTVSNGKGEVELLKELEQIGRHPTKTHTIIIDDYRCYGAGNRVLEDLILAINPKYKFAFGTYHPLIPNDVLIAKV
jgi:hypothetical protein